MQGLYFMACQEIAYLYIEGAWTWLRANNPAWVNKEAIAKQAIIKAWENRASERVTIAEYLAAVNFWKQLIIMGVNLYAERTGASQPGGGYPAQEKTGIPAGEETEIVAPQNKTYDRGRAQAQIEGYRQDVSGRPEEKISGEEKSGGPGQS